MLRSEKPMHIPMFPDNKAIKNSCCIEHLTESFCTLNKVKQ